MRMDPMSVAKRPYWKLRNGRYRWQKPAGFALAYAWRRRLRATTWVAISGSVGKTTTKELLGAILAAQGPTARTPGNWNLRKTGGVPATILRTRPAHRYAVVETSIQDPGDMAPVARLIKPDVAVMLAIKRCHTNKFRTLEAIAAEKARLLQALPPSGYAVINQDNPHIAAMAQSLRCRVIRFGSGADCDLRLLAAESRWPDRLRLQIEADGGRHAVRTRLVGTHWAPTVLASLATARACGVPLASAIATLGAVEPFWARMQPVTLPDSGATVLRDEWNGSVDTFEPAFKVMAEATAPRKWLVLSDFSDTMKKRRARAKQLGGKAAELADGAVFVGDYADRSAEAAVRAGLSPARVRHVVSPAGAVAFLKGELRAGDLVLLKGQTSHHLSRVYLGLLGEVRCDRLTCPMQILCDTCSELGMAWGPELHGLMAEPDSLV
jgi:UDP-N-acetylmuramoyl-tripeptide--D-alanyl-D-alanine ligase